MPVLGCGGLLKLRREAPTPCILTSDSFDWVANTIDLDCEGWWTGDHICLQAPGGLPIFDNGVPGAIDGVAMYFGSQWFLGPNRDHVDAENDAFYKTDTEEYIPGRFGDDANFYFIGGDVNGDGDVNGEDLITDRCYYIHVDELGRVSFYNDRCTALSGRYEDRVDLINVDFDFIILSPFGSSEYQNAVWECISALGDYAFSDVQENGVIPIDSICDHPPDYLIPEFDPAELENADVRPRGQNQKFPYWEILCDMREWSLELDAPSVDTTSVGEKFGESVKSLVSGGGTIEFFIDKVCREEGQNDGLMLMQLLFMTEQGAKANAEFWILNRDENCCDCLPSDCDSLPGGLYYTADIYITRTAINLRPTELVAGTANFVTTGEIRLVSSAA